MAGAALGPGVRVGRGGGRPFIHSLRGLDTKYTSVFALFWYLDTF